MWKFARKLRVKGAVQNAGPMFETLEDRCLMSASTHAAPLAASKPLAAAKKPAVVVTKTVAKAVVKPATKTATATAAATTAWVPNSIITSAAPSVVGKWVGTMTPDGSTTSQAFSVDFAFQRGVAATGTFDFGAIMGNQSVVSTMVFSLHKNVRLLISTPTVLAGFTGALTSNGQILYGAYSFNSPKGWQAGIFMLTRQ